jgi:hypothetical protein
MLTTIVVIVLVLMLIGALPRWSYSRDWGYPPAGFITTLLIILIILALLGRI